MSSFSDPSSRRQLAEMKHTLSIARVARDEVRVAYAQSTQRLDAARSELATIQRRGELAQQINDQETVTVAARFSESQRSTIALLERKVAVQHDELALVERTVNEMEEELRSVTGIGPRGESTADRASDDDDAPRAEPAEYRNLGAAARARIADERLAELKRKMGKS